MKKRPTLFSYRLRVSLAMALFAIIPFSIMGMNFIHAEKAKLEENALAQYPGLEVVLSGGVASNSRLRSVMAPLGAVFGAPQYSTDNAMGVAILANRLK